MSIFSRLRRGRQTPPQAPVEEYNPMYAPRPPDAVQAEPAEPIERTHFSRRSRLKARLNGNVLPEVSGDFPDPDAPEPIERTHFSRRSRLKARLNGNVLPDVNADTMEVE